MDILLQTYIMKQHRCKAITMEGYIRYVDNFDSMKGYKRHLIISMVLKAIRRIDNFNGMEGYVTLIVLLSMQCHEGINYTVGHSRSPHIIQEQDNAHYMITTSCTQARLPPNGVMDPVVYREAFVISENSTKTSREWITRENSNQVQRLQE